MELDWLSFAAVALLCLTANAIADAWSAASVARGGDDRTVTRTEPVSAARAAGATSKPANTAEHATSARNRPR